MAKKQQLKVHVNPSVCSVYQHQPKVEENINTTHSFPTTRKPVVWLRMALL